MDCVIDQEAIADVINGKKFRYFLVGLTTANYQLEPLRKIIETILGKLRGS